MQFPQILWLSQNSQVGTPLRPIVSIGGSITYGVAKELAHIIKPLVGQSPHHLKNTKHFVQQLQGKKLEQRLQQDTTHPQRTNIAIPQITSLLEFCLTNTYFLFLGMYYEQVQGAAMGSPISPLIANIFMEEFEVKALSSTHPIPIAKVCR